MFLKKRLVFSFLVLTLLAATGCVAPPLPASQAGVDLKPGRYLAAYYFAPDFAPDQVTYHLEPFSMEATEGVDPDTFLTQFHTALAKAWETNGLKLGPREKACRVTGTIHRVSLRGVFLRFLTGKISAHLDVSGSISRNGEVLFAFRDRFSVSSPVSPGPAAPKEAELLLQHLCQEFAHHLLNELLLQGLPRDSE
ncbi:MAG: hypothetical protein AB1491_04985 [Thermodesulfobacteriota bacterium]